MVKTFGELDEYIDFSNVNDKYVHIFINILYNVVKYGVDKDYLHQAYYLTKDEAEGIKMFEENKISSYEEIHISFIFRKEVGIINAYERYNR